jgi:SAM-dependent methyltransferase
LIELLHDQVAVAVGADPDWFSLVEHRAPAVCRVLGFAEHLPFPNESFDLAICSWVLEHLARPQCAFAEVARVLQSPDPASGQPGGHLVFLAPNAAHPLTWLNRALGRLGDCHRRLVKHLYQRAEEDTFPVVYRANTRQSVERLAAEVGLVSVAVHPVGDPTYLAFNEPFYRLAVLVERLTPQQMKVHLVGDFVKGEL